MDLTSPVPRAFSWSFAFLAVGIPAVWMVYAAVFDPQTRQWFVSLDGAAGAMMVGGPFLVLALAAIRRRISHAAWGLLCVGLAIVAVLFGLALSVGNGGAVPQSGINAGIYALVLNLWQYVAAIGSAVIGIGFDLASRRRTSVE